MNRNSTQNIKRNESLNTTQKRKVPRKEKEVLNYHKTQIDNVMHKIVQKENVAHNIIQNKNIQLIKMQKPVTKENTDNTQKKIYRSDCDNNLINNGLSKAINNKTKESSNKLVS